MAKLAAIREFILRPGVSEAEFEHFVIREGNPAWLQVPAGMSLSVLKGDRSDRAECYVQLDGAAASGREGRQCAD